MKKILLIILLQTALSCITNSGSLRFFSKEAVEKFRISPDYNELGAYSEYHNCVYRKVLQGNIDSLGHVVKFIYPYLFENFQSDIGPALRFSFVKDASDEYHFIPLGIWHEIQFHNKLYERSETRQVNGYHRQVEILKDSMRAQPFDTKCYSFLLASEMFDVTDLSEQERWYRLNRLIEIVAEINEPYLRNGTDPIAVEGHLYNAKVSRSTRELVRDLVHNRSYHTAAFEEEFGYMMVTVDFSINRRPRLLMHFLPFVERQVHGGCGGDVFPGCQ